MAEQSVHNLLSSGCSKWSSNKAAGEEKPQAYRVPVALPNATGVHVEDFFDPRTTLGDIFSILLQLNFDIDTRGQIELHQGIHRLRRWLHDVHQPLMGSNLKLLAGLLIRVR